MLPSPLLLLLSALSLLPSPSCAHGSHAPDHSDPSLTWAERHLRSEHHISNYDAGAFFTLHDFDQDQHLSREELLRTYGLLNDANNPEHPSNSPEDLDRVWNAVRAQIDTDRDDEISRQEWMDWSRKGGVLPDFGTGVGHHGDTEYEYEIHHFEKFHENDKPDGSDMVMHPEDVEHLKYHEEHEQAGAVEKTLENLPVIDANIPAKFKVQVGR